MVQDTKAADSDEPVEKFFKNDGSCQHVYTIDDEIGILCRLCGYVITEIRDVSPPFVSNYLRITFLDNIFNLCITS